MIKEILSWTRVIAIILGWLLLTIMGMPFLMLGFLYEFFSGSFKLGIEVAQAYLKLFVKAKLRN